MLQCHQADNVEFDLRYVSYFWWHHVAPNVAFVLMLHVLETSKIYDGVMRGVAYQDTKLGTVKSYKCMHKIYSYFNGLLVSSVDRFQLRKRTLY